MLGLDKRTKNNQERTSTTMVVADGTDLFHQNLYRVNVRKYEAKFWFRGMS